MCVFVRMYVGVCASWGWGSALGWSSFHQGSALCTPLASPAPRRGSRVICSVLWCRHGVLVVSGEALTPIRPSPYPPAPPPFSILLLLTTTSPGSLTPSPTLRRHTSLSLLSQHPSSSLSGQCRGKSCWRRPAEVTSLPADNLLREISREEIREQERVEDRERERQRRRQEGWMERNLAKFLVPDLLRQALPILQANFPSVVKHLLLSQCPQWGEGSSEGGKREWVRIHDEL